jgi:predicted amidohydrolase YtcJ
VVVAVLPVVAGEEAAAVVGNDENSVDLKVLDRNLFEIPASEISDATVTATIFDGRTV